MSAISVAKYKVSPTLEVSRAVTGLWQIADLEKNGETLDPAKTSLAMASYVEAGLTTFDMADHYGSAEIIAGYFLKHNPLGSQATMMTKWVPKPGTLSKSQVRDAVLERCTRLGIEKLPHLQYHSWKFSDLNWLDQMFWLQEFKEEGLIQNIGVTNFDTAHLRVARKSGVDIVSNQISYSLVDQRGGGRMAQFCQEEGISIFAYGTLLGGFLSNKWLGADEPKGDALANMSLMKYKRFIDAAGGWKLFQSVLWEIYEVAQDVGQSISVVASKYMLHQPVVAAVIIGARLGQNNHVEDSINLFSFDLSQTHLEKIRGAISRFTPIPGDCGDEYRKPPFLTASGDLHDHLEDFPKMYQPIKVSESRSRIDSGTAWEAIAGYSRAIREGNRILTAGTTATHGDRIIGGADPKAQTHYIIDKIEASLESLGATLADVIRTRIFIADPSLAIAISEAHGERFGEIRPANTMVVARLVGDEYLVEIEAEAVVKR